MDDGKTSDQGIWKSQTCYSLTFVRSGIIYTGSGTAGYVGYYGHYWSRMARLVVDAYNLNVGFTDVNPLYADRRFYGFPLRCLYPGSA